MRDPATLRRSGGQLAPRPRWQGDSDTHAVNSHTLLFSMDWTLKSRTRWPKVTVTWPHEEEIRLELWRKQLLEPAVFGEWRRPFARSKASSQPRWDIWAESSRILRIRMYGRTEM